MPQMRDDASGAGPGLTSADSNFTLLGSGNQNIDLSAAILVLLDEINTLRTHVAIGLAAKTVAQFKTAFDSKKTT